MSTRPLLGGGGEGPGDEVLGAAHNTPCTNFQARRLPPILVNIKAASRGATGTHAMSQCDLHGLLSRLLPVRLHVYSLL